MDKTYQNITYAVTLPSSLFIPENLGDIISLTDEELAKLQTSAGMKRAELTDFINLGFRIPRNFRLIDGYMDRVRPKLSHVIEAQGDYGSPESRNLAGVIVVTREATESGTEFFCYDKVTVAPPLRKNGILGNMILTEHHVDSGVNNNKPKALRTSDESAHNAYIRYSDDWLPVGHYFIHVFYPTTKKDAHESARQNFPEIAGHLSAMPPTIVPIHSPVLME